MEDTKIKSVNVSSFYSKDNEENGVWYEAKVKGVGTNIEFLVYGPNSTPAAIAQDEYQKAKDTILKIESVEARNKAMDKALAEYASKLCGDIRGKDGVGLVNNNGTPVSKSDIKDILYNSPIIASDIAKFESNQNNFLLN